MTTTALPPNNVAANYQKFLDRYNKAQGSNIKRPPPGQYVLTIVDVKVTDTSFEWTSKDKTMKGEFPSKAVSWTFLDPVAGNSFPGRYWNIPLIGIEDVASLPDNVQKRINIQDSQFKHNVEKVLGFDAPDPFAALEAFGEHCRIAVEKGSPVRARVTLKNGKGDYADEFDSERINKVL
jgi:hypothetical protein